MNRRSFLCAVGVAGLGLTAGCNDSPSESSGTETAVPPPQTDAPVQETEPTTSMAADGTESGGETQTDTRTETESESDTDTTGREYVVASDGSGDFRSLAAAQRTATDGDVLRLRGRRFESQIEKRLTYVGDGQDATTLTVPAITGTPTFTDLTVVLSDSRPYVANRITTVRSRVRGSTLQSQIEATASVFDSAITVLSGTISASDTVFNEPVEQPNPDDTSLVNDTAAKANFRDCTFAGQVTHFSRLRFIAEGCSFETPFVSAGPTSLVNCTLNGLEALDGSSGYVSESELHGARQIDGAFRRPEPTDTDTHEQFFLTHNRITDQVTVGTNNRASLLYNEFVAGDDIDWFVDGVGPKHLYKNAFEGADIRIQVGDTELYDEHDQLGNYYSTFDITDVDGDGVGRLPREIPGSTDLTDEYPLTRARFDRLQKS